MVEIGTIFHNENVQLITHLKLLLGGEEEKTMIAVDDAMNANIHRLTIRLIQVTDVYTLENFPSLSTLIAKKRKEN